MYSNKSHDVCISHIRFLHKHGFSPYKPGAGGATPVCAPLDHGGAFFLRNDARFDALQDVAYSILPTHGCCEAKIRP